MAAPDCGVLGPAVRASPSPSQARKDLRGLCLSVGPRSIRRCPRRPYRTLERCVPVESDSELRWQDPGHGSPPLPDRGRPLPPRELRLAPPPSLPGGGECASGLDSDLGRLLRMAHAAGPPRAWRPGCSLSPFQADARVTPRRGSGAGPRWPQWPGRSRRRGRWLTGRLGALARTGVPVPAHSPPGRPPGSSTVQGGQVHQAPAEWERT